MLRSSFRTVQRSPIRLVSRHLSRIEVPLLQRIRSPDWQSKIAIMDGTTSNGISYQQLDQRSSALAASILNAESRRGEVGSTKSVGAFHKPGVMFTLAMLATWKLGRTFVPLCSTHSLNELEYIATDSNVGTMVCHREDDLIVEVRDKFSRSLLETTSLQSTGPSSPSSPPVSAGTSDAVVIYTSGTTGRPKGVVHTHTGLQFMIDSVATEWKYTSSDKILHFLPLYHVHGLLNKLLCMLHVGGTVEFHANANAAHLWHRLADDVNRPDKLTLFMAVPTVYAKMLEFADSAHFDSATKKNALQTVKQLRLMVSGSAALPDVIMDRWKTLTGQSLLERYGMTEIGMALTNPYEPVSARRKGYVGKPFPHVECRLVDDHGAKIDAIDTPGELQVSGPLVFKHYRNNPTATNETFDTTSGKRWFKTGDISEVDKDGNYKILGRKSADIIKSAGYKISALEIERELLSHPRILEAAVVGRPDDVLGERIVAVIALRNGMSADYSRLDVELEKFLDSRLAKYKQPRQYCYVEHIPRNHMGKVNKKSLLKDLKLV